MKLKYGTEWKEEVVRPSYLHIVREGVDYVVFFDYRERMRVAPVLAGGPKGYVETELNSLIDRAIQLLNKKGKQPWKNNTKKIAG